MAYRSEIERALGEMISDEVANKFQGLAVVRAQQKWPRLVACERKWDGGLDAHANGSFGAGREGTRSISRNAVDHALKEWIQHRHRTGECAAFTGWSPRFPRQSGTRFGRL